MLLSASLKFRVRPNGDLWQDSNGPISIYLDKVADTHYYIGADFPYMVALWDDGQQFASYRATKDDSILDFANCIYAVYKHLNAPVVIAKTENGELLIHHLLKKRCHKVFMSPRQSGRTLKDFGMEMTHMNVSLMVENLDLLMRFGVKERKPEDIIHDPYLLDELKSVRVKHDGTLGAAPGHDVHAPLALLMAAWAAVERKPDLIKKRHFVIPVKQSTIYQPKATFEELGHAA